MEVFVVDVVVGVSVVVDDGVEVKHIGLQQ